MTSLERFEALNDAITMLSKGFSDARVSKRFDAFLGRSPDYEKNVEHVELHTVHPELGLEDAGSQDTTSQDVLLGGVIVGLLIESTLSRKYLALSISWYSFDLSKHF